VLERAVAAGPVLPLRFGIVLRDDEAVVEELLEARHDELAALLKRFERLVELRVKAFYVEEAVLREIVRSDPAIARLNEATRGAPEAALHPQRIRLGEAIARALEARRESDARAILGRLRPLAEEVVVEESDATRALTASFLVDRGRVEAFDRVMDELARAHEGLITFKYLGPLPPHSFVSFREQS
jgi:Gas vesicle synthesis protein GvpL/GvpF